MGTATESRPVTALSASLAGLQAGMTGVFCMLAWMGASAAWKRLSFWTAENLIATLFYGNAALRRGFGSTTVSGLALYVFLYSLLGALFAMAVGGRLPRLRALLLGILFGLSWYYLSFHLLWKSVTPAVALLHPERPTLIGHAIYGALLGRFPAYLRGDGPEAALPEPLASEPPVAEEHSETPEA